MAPEACVLLGEKIGCGNVCLCLPNHHMKFTCKNPLSSFSKMHTILTQDRRFDSTDSKNQSWPLLGFHDARGYTLTNLSLTWVKPWVATNDDVVTKHVPQKQQLLVKNTHTKKTHFKFQTRADNEYETNVNASSRLHSLASR